MMRMNKTAKIIIGAIAVLTFFAYMAPALFLSDGVDAYSGEQKAQAQQAIDDVEQALSSPSIYKLYTTKISVQDLTPTGQTLCPYSANVTLHTFFGIRYATYEVQPNCSVTPA